MSTTPPLPDDVWREIERLRAALPRIDDDVLWECGMGELAGPVSYPYDPTTRLILTALAEIAEHVADLQEAAELATTNDLDEQIARARTWKLQALARRVRAALDGEMTENTATTITDERGG